MVQFKYEKKKKNLNSLSFANIYNTSINILMHSPSTNLHMDLDDIDRFIAQKTACIHTSI